MGINSCGRSKHSDCSLCWPWLSRGGHINDSFTVTFGAKYMTGMVTSVLSVLLKIILFISLKTTKNTSKIHISEVCDLTLVM